MAVTGGIPCDHRGAHASAAAAAPPHEEQASQQASHSDMAGVVSARADESLAAAADLRNLNQNDGSQ